MIVLGLRKALMWPDPLLSEYLMLQHDITPLLVINGKHKPYQLKSADNNPPYLKHTQQIPSKESANSWGSSLLLYQGENSAINHQRLGTVKTQKRIRISFPLLQRKKAKQNMQAWTHVTQTKRIKKKKAQDTHAYAQTQHETWKSPKTKTQQSK